MCAWAGPGQDGPGPGRDGPGRTGSGPVRPGPGPGRTGPDRAGPPARLQELGSCLVEFESVSYPVYPMPGHTLADTPAVHRHTLADTPAVHRRPTREQQAAGEPPKRRWGACGVREKGREGRGQGRQTAECWAAAGVGWPVWVPARGQVRQAGGAGPMMGGSWAIVFSLARPGRRDTDRVTDSDSPTSEGALRMTDVWPVTGFSRILVIKSDRGCKRSRQANVTRRVDCCLNPKFRIAMLRQSLLR
jgi:hypothetical protein